MRTTDPPQFCSHRPHVKDRRTRRTNTELISGRTNTDSDIRYLLFVFEIRNLELTCTRV